MRRGWIGVAVGAAAIVGGSIASAHDVGCCEVECHSTDAAGRILHSVQRRDMPQAECENRFPECATTWSPESCDANPERGLRMYRDDGEE